MRSNILLRNQSAKPHADLIVIGVASKDLSEGVMKRTGEPSTKSLSGGHNSYLIPTEAIERVCKWK